MHRMLGFSVVFLSLIFIASSTGADSPKGKWGKVTPIADNNHPNLYYNQSEVDELRKMVLVQKRPQDLVDVYNNSIKNVSALSASSDCYSETMNNMKAALSYMLEPTSAKAAAIRASLLSYVVKFPKGLDPWDVGCFRGYPAAWMFDLIQAYNPKTISATEKTNLKNWFAKSAERLKFDTRDAKAVSGPGTYAVPNTTHEGKTQNPFPNWYSRFMGPSLAAALVSGNQADVDYWADSGWPHDLLTFDAVTSTYPSDSANRYDMVMFLLSVYPSGANTDTYDREGYNRSNHTWHTVDYTWGDYHWAQIFGSLIGAEMAYHNGMTAVFGITDARGTEPALLRTFKRAIGSRNELDSQPANSTKHPIIGWRPVIYMAQRRYNDPMIENAIVSIGSYNGIGPNGQRANQMSADHIPWEVLKFFGYPRRIAWQPDRR
jgi:hypothetical protein